MRATIDSNGARSAHWLDWCCWLFFENRSQGQFLCRLQDVSWGKQECEIEMSPDSFGVKQKCTYYESRSTISCSWGLETCFNNPQRGGFLSLITKSTHTGLDTQLPNVLYLHNQPAPGSFCAPLPQPTPSSLQLLTFTLISFCFAEKKDREKDSHTSGHRKLWPS